MGSPRSGGEVSAILLVFAGVLGALAAPETARAQAPKGTSSPSDSYWVFVGTYTSGRGENKSEGIYVLDLDARTGKLGEPRLAAKSGDPSFLAVHPSQKFLYSVNEMSEFQGRRGGGVSAFAIDAANGSLSALNQQSSRGDGPCHLVVDRLGKNVLVANYGGGSVACLPIEPDGTLRAALSFHQHLGSGTDRRR